MRAIAAWAWIIIVAGCTGTGTDDGFVVVDGKADAVGFSYGIFASWEYDYEQPSPILAAFHDVSTGVPEGFSGHFDLSVYDEEDGTTTYSSGVFQLYEQNGRSRILLQGSDGQEVARYDWSYSDGTLRLGEHELSRLNRREEALVQCEAFEVLDFEFEEGFTPWEYPSVDVDPAADGGYEVSLGSCAFDESEGDAITFTTAANGDIEARVVTTYDETYIVRVPAGLPSRGEVLRAADGEEPGLMASLVCFPPVVRPPTEPETPGVTQFTCTTRRPEASGQTATIRFGVVGLDDPETMELSWPDEVETPITVEPDTSYAYTLEGGMADGYLAFVNGKLRLFSDQIGYEFGELELYQNSGFEHGYFRFEMMDPDHTEFYTEVDCVLE